jgi:hypothetical protein
MPTNLHEEAFDYLKDVITFAIGNLPYDRAIVRPRIQMNYSLQIEGKSVAPDMTITLTSAAEPAEDVVVSGLAECALSEDFDHVFTKMGNEVTAHPEVDFAIIGVINEATSYESPEDGSTAFKTLISDDATDFPLSLKSFIRQRSTPRQSDQPVRVADHDWCHVRSVEYYVWARGPGADGTPINIHDHDHDRMAYGVSFHIHLLPRYLTLHRP